ncbi:tyrosine-type recombinase/integrase [Streptomyces sp. NPDC051662]|uniref:tyrosine-type recombinase/integrase n=1 Tax=Streptomyces sp. NPDC051662 TaxID=3154750 RepID=UPI00341E0EFA
MIRRARKELAATQPEFAHVHFAPHDFRRLFATELVNNGLPLHIGAALLGPLDTRTTRGYVAVFDRRRVELGSCGRPYGTPYAHEHACIRCPMPSINPKMPARLHELEEDLTARRKRAIEEDWRGEVEGLDLTLTFLRGKREQAPAAFSSAKSGDPVCCNSRRTGHRRSKNACVIAETASPVARPVKEI